MTRKLTTNKLMEGKEVSKPCWQLEYCPYGCLVENVEIKEELTRDTCSVFGHICPVFSHAEPFIDDENIYDYVKFVTTPEHGYLVVPIDVMNDYPNVLKEISEFSYEENGYWYLEEDRDAEIFINESQINPEEIEDIE